MTSKRLRQKWLFWKDGCEYDEQEIYLPHDAMIYENRDAALETGTQPDIFLAGNTFILQVSTAMSLSRTRGSCWNSRVCT